MADSKPSHDPLRRVARLALNLHWTWSPPALRLFAGLDPGLWEATNHDPLRTLRGLTPERRAELVASPAFAALLAESERALADYLKTRTWFERTARGALRGLRVAYFSAEFALHESMPQYAGGLGVLAGDHLRSASDLGIPLAGVGLLYRRGYYRQSFEADGSTRVTYPVYEPADGPLEDTGQRITVPLGRATLHARVWKVQVGRVPLFLLDADDPRNPARLRTLTHYLYGGDQDVRIQQELLLGVGGAIALERLGWGDAVYHLNEGHAAFAVLERLARLREAGLTWPDAYERVRQRTVFTTHTPVPAGHDRFARAMMRRYLSTFAARLGLRFRDFLSLGQEVPGDPREPFCMTVLALSCARRSNGVSALHGRVSREMWQKMYGVERPEDVPIDHVTNGIHTATWLAPEMRGLVDRYLRPKWVGGGPKDDPWRYARRIPPRELWAVRNALRARLVHFIRRRVAEQLQRGFAPQEALRAVHETFDDRVLTIGFARRFATYKRAVLLFRDPARLARILNAPGRPVQVVFAGKAHPRDLPGQAFARLIYRQARMADFRGRIVLLEEYDMHVGRMLVAGCDVWLNNPRRPQEASGTSGMKPPLHGGINCSVLDGWWPEACDGRNGWTIGDEYILSSTQAQDRRDAASLYRLLEEEIVPDFYDRGRDGLPRRWLRRALASMQSICGRFNSHRMVGEYLERYAEALG